MGFDDFGEEFGVVTAACFEEEFSRGGALQGSRRDVSVKEAVVHKSFGGIGGLVGSSCSCIYYTSSLMVKVCSCLTAQYENGCKADGAGGTGNKIFGIYGVVGQAWEGSWFNPSETRWRKRQVFDC